MRRTLMILCIAALICMNITAVSIAAATTWEIKATDGTYGKNINGLQDGDIVYFHNGDYPSTFFTYSYGLFNAANITFKGESRDGVIFHVDYFFKILEPGVRIEDITFYQNGPTFKISSSDVVINNCVFVGGSAAVSIERITYNMEPYVGENCKITNSIFKDISPEGSYIIALHGSNNKIINNTFSLNYNEIRSPNFNEFRFLDDDMGHGSNNEIFLNTITDTGNHVSRAINQQSFVSPSPVTYTYNGMTYNKQLGNYWSDYTGIDADGDGIGDTPFTLYAGSVDPDTGSVDPQTMIIDPTPLMKPVSYYSFGNLLQNVGVEPNNGKSGDIFSVSYNQLITFSYTDNSADEVDIDIKFDNGDPEINKPMTGGHPTWTYSTTFAKKGKATVTYTIQKSGSLDQTITFDIYIDPSGFVYDSDTGQRIEGASVYLQQQDNNVWKNVVTGQSIMKPDENPYITDKNGMYQWDVLAGTYRVHVEKAGYDPADSSSVTVTLNNPVTNLNVGLHRNSEGTQIPEFPSVAVPVATVLGLVTIISRKKHGL